MRAAAAVKPKHVLFALAALLGACGLEATPPPQHAPTSQQTPTPPPSSPAAPTPEAPSRAPEAVRVAPPPLPPPHGEAFHALAQAPLELRAAHGRQIQSMRCDTLVANPTQFDHWHRLDLDRDGQNEYLVFTTLEAFGGGNNYSRYLILYRYVNPVWFPALVAFVGGKGGAQVDSAIIWRDSDRLILRAHFPADGDGTCCPSIPGEIAYSISSAGELSPLPPPENPTANAYHFMLLIAAGCGN